MAAASQTFEVAHDCGARVTLPGEGPTMGLNCGACGRKFQTVAIACRPKLDNAGLLEAIDDLLEFAEGAETEVLEELLESELLLPGGIRRADGSWLERGAVALTEHSPRGLDFELATVFDPEERPYLPAFTDIDRLRAFAKSAGATETKALRMPGLVALGLLTAKPYEGLVLNPGGRETVQIPRSVVEPLFAGQTTDD